MMIKWVAFFMAWFALAFGASTDDIKKLSARLDELEGRKCTLMGVTTPSGSANICVELIRPKESATE